MKRKKKNVKKKKKRERAFGEVVGESNQTKHKKVFEEFVV